MCDFNEEELTPMQNEIYRAIVFDGCDIKQLQQQYHISRATVVTHLDAICHKKQIWGTNRLFALQTQFWKNFRQQIQWNCTLCLYNQNKCANVDSQFYDESLLDSNTASNMVCSHFKTKGKQTNEEH